MEEKISVIVPIYNTEEYLEKCINSIINQTYRNLEIILINDGSTDNSLNICKEFEKKDSRIKVISQKNQGVAYTRNVGLSNATGDYIAFVDSDDYIKLNFYEELYKCSQRYDADIAMCEFSLINEKNEKIEYNLKKQKKKEIEYEEKIEKKCLRNDKKFEILYKGSKTGLAGVMIWNKIYRRRIFNNISYNSGTIHEDESMAHIILDKANRIAYTTEELYMYRRRKNSITTSKYTIKRQEIIDALEQRYLFFKAKKKKKFIGRALQDYVFFIIIHYKYSCSNNLGKDVLNSLRKRMKKRITEIITCIHLKLWIRIMAIIFLACPKLTIKTLLLFKRNLTI